MNRKTGSRAAAPRTSSWRLFAGALALAGAAAVYGEDMVIDVDTTLTEDTDWREYDALVVNDGVTLDLNGHRLWVSDINGTGRIVTTAAAPELPSYKYYRFKIEGTGGAYSQLSEVKLFDADGDYIANDSFTLLWDATTVGADNNNTFPAGEAPANAVDNNVDTKWLDFRANEKFPQPRDAIWITFQFDEPQTVSRYEWWTANDTEAWATRQLTAWRLQGSDDNETWVDLDAQSARDDLPIVNYELAFSGPAALQRAEIHIDVPQVGETARLGNRFLEGGESVEDNDTVLITGLITVYKEGEGTLVMSRAGQAFMGGLEVVEGTLTIPGSLTGETYQSLYTLKNELGGSPQRVVVHEGAVLETNGNYDFYLAQVILDGGTVSNLARDMENTGYNADALTALTADSYIVTSFHYLWRDRVCDLGGHTLSVQMPTGNKRFYLGTDEIKNGKLVISPVEPANLGLADYWGCLYVFSGNGNRSPTLDLDITTCLELYGDLYVHDLTFRCGRRWGWGTAGKKVYLYGTFKPVTLYYPSIEFQNGSRLDLTDVEGVFSTTSLDFKRNATADTEGVNYVLTYADGASVEIDVTGREFALGDQAVAWDAMPANLATLSFSFYDSGTNVDATVTTDGIYFGRDVMSTDVATATWIGSVDGDVENPANWVCQNAAGITVKDAVPSVNTFVYLSRDVGIQIPADTRLECAQLVIENCTLADDCDWSGLASLNVVSTGTVIDLNGHKLTLTGFPGIVEITDSAGGGELRVNVPAGTTLTNTAVSFTGDFAFVKGGEGTFVATKAGQTYTGGTTVAAGVLRAGSDDYSRPLGAARSVIDIDDGAVFDLNGRQFASGYRFNVNDGGTLVIDSAFTSSGAPSFAAFEYNGDAVRVGDTEIKVTNNANGSSGSAFWRNRVNPSLPWRVTFHYWAVMPEGNYDPGDGVTLLFQNDNRGLNALGASGGNVGANTDGTIPAITPSYGCFYNIAFKRSFGFIENGAKHGEVTVDGLTEVDGHNVALGFEMQSGIDVVIEYNGEGLLRQTMTQGDKVMTAYRNVDLAAWLGSSAYVGFTGGCGTYSREQHVSDFTFTQLNVLIPLDPSDTVWQRNGAGSNYEVYGDDEPSVLGVTKNVIRVTKDKGDHATLMLKQQLDAEAPFVISGSYLRVDDPLENEEPGHGVAFIFHNDALDANGGSGAARGFADGGFETAIGWAFNILGAQRLEAVDKAAVVEDEVYDVGELAGIRFDSELPVDFTITYTNSVLSIDLAQTVGGEELTFTASREVNFAEEFDSGRMYFAITGGTDDNWSKQLVYDLTYTQLNPSVTGYMGVGNVRATGAATIEINQQSTETAAAAIAHLTLVGGASVAVRATGTSNVNYELHVGEFLFEGEKGRPSLALEDNGFGRGTLRIGGITMEEPGTLLLANAYQVAAIGEDPITVKLPDFLGSWPVLNIVNVAPPRRPVSEDFVFDSPVPEPRSLRLTAGILYAVHNVGLFIHIK